MLKVRDLMTTDLTTVSPDSTLRDAMELLARRHVTGAPVVTGNRVVGVVTMTDLLRVASSVPSVPTQREEQVDWGEALEPSLADDVEAGDEAAGAFFSEFWDDAGADVEQRFEAVETPEWDALDDHVVSEAMSTNVIALPPSASAESAAVLMRDRRIHRVLVIEDGALVGIVSALDIANAAADHRFTARTYVFNRGRDFDDRGE